MTILATLFFTCCTNSSNSEDKERIAQLEAQIAQLQSQSNKTQQSSSTNSGISDSENYSHTYSSPHRQKNNPSQFVGTYEMVDEIGNTWVIKLNSDETATMGLKGGNEVAYASWDLVNYLDYNPGLKFDDERMSVYFPSGEGKPFLPCIKDGYFYLDPDATQAKNPRKRLPIKKIK